MFELEVSLPQQTDLTRVPATVEAVCAAEGLRRALKATLAKYPGSVHWHYRRDRERGTLEITLWPEQSRLWFKVSRGRAGVWIEELLPRLSEALAAALTATMVSGGDQGAER